MSEHDPIRRDLLGAGLLLGGAALLPTLAAAAETPATAAAPATAGGGRLTFHAIDTHHGATIGTLRVDLSRFDDGQFRRIKTFDTVKNGRSDGALLEGVDFRAGRYELLLHLDDYFAALGTRLPSPSFLAKVPLRFAVADAAQRYHIPVLFNPWSYSYYRGS